jgi:hypothetical protein|tara:strand:+ start:330 stop:515 length:186 start_codon:yes stop_codon:yes gene_type:complete
MLSQLSVAAKVYVEESHQIAAWNYLEGQVSEEVLDTFFEIFCAGNDCLFQPDGQYKEQIVP